MKTIIVKVRFTPEQIEWLKRTGAKESRKISTEVRHRITKLYEAERRVYIKGNL